MERIAVYGKGGIGKSVVATSLSACYALQQKKVLHVGCDPKRDSTVRLLGLDTEPVTVLERLGRNPNAVKTGDVIMTGRLGIDCCECGGPTPGMGCAGRGVARTLEFLEEREVFEASSYDVVMFDVLGDVVCGGFAAPLRVGFAQKVLVVTSEEPMSLYAANNICRAVQTYAANGVVLAGLVANLRNNETDPSIFELFADLINSRVLAVIPRDEAIIEAERRMETVLERAPQTPVSATFRALSEAVLDIDPSNTPEPHPLSDTELYRFVRDE